jgi:hypothetical protein
MFESTRSSFDWDSIHAEIQGLSVAVGRLFAQTYKTNRVNSLDLLEAYKGLRRALPREVKSLMHEARKFKPRHIGATAAHKATQGD